MKFLLSVYDKFLGAIERRLPWLTIIAFLLGVGVAKYNTAFAESVDSGVNGFIDAYGLIAPIVIYLILTPSLTRVLTSTQSTGFVLKMLFWFAGTRIFALLWAVIFTAFIFHLPMYSDSTSSFSTAFPKAMSDLGWMLTHSIYFYAIYASLFSIYIAVKVKVIGQFFSSGVVLIEKLGKQLILFIPLFMFAIGAYVSHLPVSIKHQVNQAYVEQMATSHTDAKATRSISSSDVKLKTVNILGLKINPETSMGMILAYIAGALLTGLACFIWHFALLAIAKYLVKEFSIRQYFKNYWVKVYPLLWSTSSEALSTPLNLYLVKKHYPRICDEIRGFCIGGGSFMGINGTVICVYVLGGLVTSILGIQVSILQLLLSVPIIFLLGYGIPGIPGELVIFAGPIAIILGLPPELTPVFLALYVGFQIGLPDSFRTGANSTDNCVNGVILQDMYEKKNLNERVVNNKDVSMEKPY